MVSSIGCARVLRLTQAVMVGRHIQTRLWRIAGVRSDLVPKVINLKQARKRKQRTDKAAQATENRARFGRTLAQKQLDETRRQQSQDALDAHRRERSETPKS